MKTDVKKIVIRITVSIMTVLMVVLVFGKICKHPNKLIENNVKYFYQEEYDSLDYVVLGSSAGQSGINPLIIEEKVKLKGYCFCVTSANSDLYLPMLKEILSRQPNATIIIDMDAIDNTLEGYNANSLWIDSIKISKNWFDSIERLEKDNRLEHYFPILKYHNNIYDIHSLLIETIGQHRSNGIDDLHGFDPIDNDRLPKEEMELLKPLNNNTTDKIELSHNEEYYLRELLDYCSNNNIEAIFIDPPKAYTTIEKLNDIQQYEGKYESASIIIEQYGYDCININKFDNLCSFTKDDFADSYHLNENGADKYSAFLAKYLIKH